MPCCIVALLALLGPRIMIILIWLLNNAYLSVGIASNFLVQLLGLVFLPWTLLAYVFSFNTFPGNEFAGLSLIGVLLTIIGLIFDLGSYGGGYRNRSYRYSS